MTEQEAEALVERLTRIWSPNTLQKPDWSNQPDLFYFGVPVGESVGIVYDTAPNQKVFFLALVQLKEHGTRRRFVHRSSNAHVKVVAQHHLPNRAAQAMAEEFTARWLPFFRRGCWLSGSSIEASAHEKAEWIQGFSREEIEAWNLKM